MKHLFRAIVRPVKRLLRPLRLRWIDFQAEASKRELAYLQQLECNEHHFQVQLEVRRQQIERGLA